MHGNVVQTNEQLQKATPSPSSPLFWRLDVAPSGHDLVIYAELIVSK